MAVTDRDGYFSAPDVYRKGDYTVDAHALNYETVTRSLPSFDGDTDMGVFTLNEKLIAPGKVTAEADRKTAAISWQAFSHSARRIISGRMSARDLTAPSRSLEVNAKP